MALTDNLVSYWTLDEASGTRADSVGGNTLADNNTVGSAAGIISNGADFESTAAEFLSIADASQTGLDLSTDFSFSLWVNIENLADFETAFIAKWEATGNQRSYRLIYDHTNDLLYCDVSTNGSAATTKQVSWNASTGTWYHVVVTYDLGGDVKFYVDGSQQGATQTGGAASIFNGTGRFDLGKAAPTVARYMDGIMDEVGIWSRVLTPTEVSELYNGGAGLTYPFITASVKDIIGMGFIPFAR